MATQTERIQRRIDRLAAMVHRLRNRMTVMMDRMPEEQNEMMLKRMAATMNRIGAIQTTIAGLQREIEVIELAGGDRQLERNALRAVRQYNRALAVLDNLHRRMVTGPRLERATAKVEEAQQALLAVMPIGGEPPGTPGTPGDPTKPSLFLLSRDPHGLSKNPMFQMEFEAFSCMVPHGSPQTPDKLQPTFSVFREFRAADIRMPDGAEVEFWGFVGEDEDGDLPVKDHSRAARGSGPWYHEAPQRHSHDPLARDRADRYE